MCSFKPSRMHGLPVWPLTSSIFFGGFSEGKRINFECHLVGVPANEALQRMTGVWVEVNDCITRVAGQKALHTVQRHTRAEI